PPPRSPLFPYTTLFRSTALSHLCWSGGALRILVLAVFLTLAELARGHLFSGFPFDLLGYALTANDEMAQAASLIGVYGLTFLARSEEHTSELQSRENLV